jgi:hypothetical protein
MADDGVCKWILNCITYLMHNIMDVVGLSGFLMHAPSRPAL